MHLDKYRLSGAAVFVAVKWILVLIPVRMKTPGDYLQLQRPGDFAAWFLDDTPEIDDRDIQCVCDERKK
jgi:hypothetical protein